VELHEKIKLNVWDHVDDFLKVYEAMKREEWNWALNSRCKYVELRIDMRDGGCIIRDRDGNRIDPKELEHQYSESKGN
jgi:hypothetical protein